ncbi:uncharacterized protein LOC135110008 [Scylla paramamosain]|uniref:uncharacterized protein LOC135110008 n=1 Tax=Scylla paramamosain TaxID=85552 RepID=UPI0030829C85
MEDRDENGRLRLPREDFIPFQRVLHRSHRGTHKRPPEDNVTSSLGRLTLHRRKERSGSLPEKRANFRRNGDAAGEVAEVRGAANVDKANFVPFQRVLHRRRKTSLPQASPLPEPRRYRDRLNWEHQRPNALHTDSHYSKHEEARRRRQRRPQKNDSHLNNLFGNHRAEEEHNGEVEGGGGGEGGDPWLSSRSSRECKIRKDFCFPSVSAFFGVWFSSFFFVIASVKLWFSPPSDKSSPLLYTSYIHQAPTAPQTLPVKVNAPARLLKGRQGLHFPSEP